MQRKITFEKVSYNNAKDVRILKPCLETWFKNPKDLNLTSPNLRYPFNFKQWLAVSYDNKKTVSFVLKQDDWIIGHFSLQMNPQKEIVHFFHVFIDRNNRGKGYGKLLVDKAISFAKNSSYRAMTLYVSPQNQAAKNLYASFGFLETGNFSQSGSPKLKLDII